MERIKWYFKQLFPLTYAGTFTENGVRHLHIWKMWFGRCFAEQDFLIK